MRRLPTLEIIRLALRHCCRRDECEDVAAWGILRTDTAGHPVTRLAD